MPNGKMPLEWAIAKSAEVEILELLVEAGANVNMLLDDDITYIHYCAACGNTEAFNYIYKSLIKPTSPDYIQLAKEFNEDMLTKSSYLKARNDRLKSKGLWANATLKPVPMRKELRFKQDRAVDEFFVTAKGHTTLHLACQSGNKEIIQYLLQLGLDPLKENKMHQNCFTIASEETRQFLESIYSKRETQELIELVNQLEPYHSIIESNQSVVVHKPTFKKRLPVHVRVAALQSRHAAREEHCEISIARPWGGSLEAENYRRHIRRDIRAIRNEMNEGIADLKRQLRNLTKLFYPETDAEKKNVSLQHDQKEEEKRLLAYPSVSYKDSLYGAHNNDNVNSGNPSSRKDDVSEGRQKDFPEQKYRPYKDPNSSLSPQKVGYSFRHTTDKVKLEEVRSVSPKVSNREDDILQAGFAEIITRWESTEENQGDKKIQSSPKEVSENSITYLAGTKERSPISKESEKSPENPLTYLAGTKERSPISNESEKSPENPLTYLAGTKERSPISNESEESPENPLSSEDEHVSVKQKGYIPHVENDEQETKPDEEDRGANLKEKTEIIDEKKNVMFVHESEKDSGCEVRSSDDSNQQIDQNLTTNGLENSNAGTNEDAKHISNPNREESLDLENDEDMYDNSVQSSQNPESMEQRNSKESDIKVFEDAKGNSVHENADDGAKYYSNSEYGVSSDSQRGGDSGNSNKRDGSVYDYSYGSTSDSGYSSNSAPHSPVDKKKEVSDSFKTDGYEYGYTEGYYSLSPLSRNGSSHTNSPTISPTMSPSANENGSLREANDSRASSRTGDIAQSTYSSTLQKSPGLKEFSSKESVGPSPLEPSNSDVPSKQSPYKSPSSRQKLNGDVKSPHRAGNSSTGEDDPKSLPLPFNEETESEHSHKSSQEVTKSSKSESSSRIKSEERENSLENSYSERKSRSRTSEDDVKCGSPTCLLKRTPKSSRKNTSSSDRSFFSCSKKSITPSPHKSRSSNRVDKNQDNQSYNSKEPEGHSGSYTSNTPKVRPDSDL